MTTSSTVSHIVVIVDRAIEAAGPLAELAASVGLSSMHCAAGRSQMLQNRKGILAALLGGSSLVSSPVEKFSLLVPAAAEEYMLAEIVDKLQLYNIGRGTVYSEDVTVFGDMAALSVSSDLPNFASTQNRARLQSELTGICCIVQRTKGDDIARLALDTGTCVPATTFGIGTGLRDKLGLLRITIPAEKEVISITASRYDAEAVMDIMIDTGRLDQPGRGFIYIYPVKKGVINTKVSRGMPSHAASIEQIIAAIDEIKGGAGWRSRQAMGEPGSRAKRTYLTNLVDLTLVCDEGRGPDLVSAAMAVGAAGATISKMRHIGTGNETAAHGEPRISPAREMCSMVIGEKQTGAIVEALEKAGAFDANTHGIIYSRPVPKACTYLAKK